MVVNSNQQEALSSLFYFVKSLIGAPSGSDRNPLALMKFNVIVSQRVFNTATRPDTTQLRINFGNPRFPDTTNPNLSF